MELTPTLILNLALLIVPPVALVLVFRQWLARYVRWTVALTALCDILLFWDELFYVQSPLPCKDLLGSIPNPLTVQHPPDAALQLHDSVDLNKIAA